jgi:hypothetical protein
MKEIENLWNEFLKLPFPSSLAGEEIEGKDVVSLDTFSSGCISTFIDNKGLLDSERLEILRNCSVDIEKILPHIKGEGELYFKALHLLSLKVVAQLNC